MLAVVASTGTQAFALVFLFFGCIPLLFIANIWMAITVWGRKSNIGSLCILVPILNPFIAAAFWPHTKAAISLWAIALVGAAISATILLAN